MTPSNSAFIWKSTLILYFAFTLSYHQLSKFGLNVVFVDVLGGYSDIWPPEDAENRAFLKKVGYFFDFWPYLSRSSAIFALH